MNVSYYLPRIDNNSSDKEIYQRNFDAISNSRALLFLPDHAGEGVFMEVGYAIGKEIIVIGFSQIGLLDHGRMTSGLWECLPKHFQTKSFKELQETIERLKYR